MQQREGAMTVTRYACSASERSGAEAIGELAGAVGHKLGHCVIQPTELRV
jgi:hypothetical protein